MLHGMWRRHVRWLGFVLCCVACGASSSRGDAAGSVPDAGKISGSAAAAGSGGTGHSGSGGAAVGSSGQTGKPSTMHDASTTDAMSGDAMSSDAATLDAAVQDAGNDAGNPLNNHPCPLVDDCGTHQGAHCPSRTPNGACNTTDVCFYCDGVSMRPSVEASCVSGKWSWRTAQPCAH
jgi:hypothetical protein